MGIALYITFLVMALVLYYGGIKYGSFIITIPLLSVSVLVLIKG